MSLSLVYRSPAIYETIMRGLYGRHYSARYRALAELVPPEADVLDVCSGPGVLYSRFLRDKGVSYTALDLNERFLACVRRSGGRALHWDVGEPRALPAADHVIMQASLYHFFPSPRLVIDRMVAAARVAAIIAEPVRNLATSRSALVAAAGRRFTDPGSGEQEHRFDEDSLAALMEPYRSRIRDTLLIPGGREKVYVLAGGPGSRGGSTG